ncbi:MAG: hypothetical protein SFT93_03825 [Rickettsiaceae bacterium]|nr:hypothetical protein [Rickettsiaceae bacterium]
MTIEDANLMDNQLKSFKYANHLSKILVGAVGLFMFTYSRYAFIFFSGAMLPSVATILTDRAEHKCASATICTFNLIGAMPFLKEVLLSSSVNDAAKDIMVNPIAWLVVYLTAFFGFAIYFTLPEIIAQFYVAKANMKITKLNEQKININAEWDIDEDKILTNTQSK